MSYSNMNGDPDYLNRAVGLGVFKSSAKEPIKDSSQRDHFAALAMHQFLAGANIPRGYDAADDFAEVCRRAYEVADAMMEARK